VDGSLFGLMTKRLNGLKTMTEKMTEKMTRCILCDSDLDPDFAVDGYCDEHCRLEAERLAEIERDEEEARWMEEYYD
jgi:hypothetical protein